MKFAATSCGLAKLVFPAAQQSKRFEAIRNRVRCSGQQGPPGRRLHRRAKTGSLPFHDRSWSARSAGRAARMACASSCQRAQRVVRRARRRARNGCSTAYTRGRNEPACCVGQRGERVERREHLLWRAFEEPAAAAREQRVAAKEMRRAGGSARLEIGDVAGVCPGTSITDTSSAGLAMLTRSPSFRRCVRCSIRSPAGP